MLGALAAAAAFPAVGYGQSRTPTIGFLHSQIPEISTPRTGAFHRGLAESGYVEGDNLTIEYRWAEGQYDRLPGLAADLVGRGVDVIVAIANHAAFAARDATTTIPIVAMLGGDVVGMGIVDSISRPGGNLTGVNVFVGGSPNEKRLEILHRMVPAVTTIGVLANPTLDIYATDFTELERVAPLLGVELVYFDASSPEQIEAAFAAMSAAGIAALLVGIDPSLEGVWRELVVSLARRYRIPTMDSGRSAVEAGGLMSYSSSLLEGYRVTGSYAGRILSGTAVADLPILQSESFEFVINLATATYLGLDVPTDLLVTADSFIE